MPLTDECTIVGDGFWPLHALVSVMIDVSQVRVFDLDWEGAHYKYTTHHF